MSVLLPVKNRLPYYFLSAAGLSAVLFFFSTGFYDNWLLTWLAPLPVCLYALQARAAHGALAAFAAYSLGALNSWGYLPLPLFAGSTILNAAAFAAAALLLRGLVQSGQAAFASFAFAAAWTSFDYVRSLVSSFGTFASLAYTQTLNLPVIQLASLTGIWGITFLLMLMPAGLAIAWDCRKQGRGCRSVLLPAGGLLAAALLYGSCRLYLPVAGPVVTVGLAAVPATRAELRSLDSASITRTLQGYSRNVDALAAAGAQVVLLPEKLAFLAPENREAGLALLSRTAARNRVVLVAGLSLQQEWLANTAVAFASNGSLTAAYDKQHLLPAYESHYTPGDSLAWLNTDGTAAGLAICKDMDFVWPARDYSRQGAGLLLVPALDFHDDGWLHARIAVLRGVEGNMAVARAAQWGLLTISDSHGRILGMTATDATTGEATLLGRLPAGGGRSLYSLTGDWLAWLCLVATTLAVCRLRWPRSD
ncbi:MULTISPECIES: nitrilase-related carbon-nitrogen hydrolase [Sporomusa]|jgi:apolipoprotein N-acyltransferase|uniref:nitrilase-related carbon-nitrogen hydrolase n=1 Tax=Sporomusa TaxID=2375 RepID=UPI0031591426